MLYLALFLTAFVEGFIEIIRSGFTIDRPEIEKRPVSYMLVIIDFVIITWILGFLYNSKIGFASINENHLLMILSTYICWLSAALMTHQFKPFKIPINIWAALGTQIKFYILIIALTAFISYFLQLPEFYRSLYLTGIVIYTFWSFIINLFIYIDKIPPKTDEIRSEFLHAYELKNPVLDLNIDLKEIEKYGIEGKFPSKSNPSLEIENMFFKEYPEVFSFLEKNLDLDSFNSERTHILRSADPYNINVLPENHLELLINHHKLNDFRRINHYLIEVNKRLVDGGVIVTNFEPIKYRYKRFLKRYPIIIANTLYFVDFIWHRVAPKLPVLQKIFFAFTKGKNRALSLSEGLGRLYYCGFEVVEFEGPG